MFKKILLTLFTLLTTTAIASNNDIVVNNQKNFNKNITIKLPTKNYRAIVLMYHSFDDNKNNDMNTHLSVFEEHMKYLKNNNFNVISSNTLVNAINHQSDLPEKSVVITFDDGWKSQKNALEILKKYHFSATIGLVTTYQNMKHYNYLQKEDFYKYKNEDFIYVSHSHTHFIKDYLKNSEIDLHNSEKTLIDLFHFINKIYIYPYGLSNKKLINTLKENHYQAAFDAGNNCTVNTKITNSFHIGRYLMNSSVNMNKFIDIVNNHKSSCKN